MGLTLTIREGDQIYIGDNIVITVMEPHTLKQWKLNFEAPPNVIIDRAEVRIKRKKLVEVKK